MKLTLVKVLWLTLCCLLVVMVRTAWLLIMPFNRASLLAVMRDESLWAALFVASHSLLFVEFALFAGSLAVYTRLRGGDLMPEWVSWAMALAMLLLAAGCFLAVSISSTPLYPIWIACDALAALSLGVAMVGYPSAMWRLAQRRSLAELEATAASLVQGQAEVLAQQRSLAELRAALATVSSRLGSAESQAESILNALREIADLAESVEAREGTVYEFIAQAHARVSNATADDPFHAPGNKIRKTNP